MPVLPAACTEGMSTQDLNVGPKHLETREQTKRVKSAQILVLSHVFSSFPCRPGCWGQTPSLQLDRALPSHPLRNKKGPLVSPTPLLMMDDCGRLLQPDSGKLIKNVLLKRERVDAGDQITSSQDETALVS